MNMTARAPVSRRRRRRRKRPRYWLRRLVFLMILLSPLAIWRGWVFFTRSLPLAAAGDAPRVVANQPVYVAVMGVDERKNDVGRSDTLILVRLDPSGEKVDLINIPRDTRVTYDDGSHSKINAAFALQGAEYVTEVVSDLLSIPRPYYVKVNFKAFEEIVDKLGGVELDVEKHYVYDDPYQDLHIDIPAGRQVLDGETALHYVRLRYDGVTNSDIARIERQQKFLQALKSKLASPSAWFQVTDLVESVRQNVQTNIPEEDQLKLLERLFAARDSVSMQTLPGTPDDRTGDWLLDEVQWKNVISSWEAE